MHLYPSCTHCCHRFHPIFWLIAELSKTAKHKLRNFNQILCHVLSDHCVQSDLFQPSLKSLIGRWWTRGYYGAVVKQKNPMLQEPNGDSSSWKHSWASFFLARPWDHFQFFVFVQKICENIGPEASKNINSWNFSQGLSLSSQSLRL